MIKIPLPHIIEKIKEKTNLSEEEINSKIEEKLKQLSGLISKEGAAHIIANELGIKLLENFTGKLQIKNILAGMRDVETVGKVQQISQISNFQRKDGSQGKVASLIIGDETGSIRVVLWGSQTDLLDQIKEGTTIKILSGYVRENNNRLEIHLNEKSKLIVNPEGEEIGEVKSYEPIRKNIEDLKENDDNIEILATIVQVFEPRFFEICPKCNKRIRQREETFFCEEHDKVEPDYSYVLNVTLDDGTETIRTVFFRRQLEELVEMKKEEILKYKDAPEKFEEIKTELIGKIIKVTGRVNKNEMFDRLELITKSVIPNPDPKEEIEKLKEKIRNKNEIEGDAEPKEKESLPETLPTVEEI